MDDSISKTAMTYNDFHEHHHSNGDIASQITCARAAQKAWVKSTTLKQRSRIAKLFARQIAENAQRLHDAVTTRQRCDYRETVSAELFPLADAAKWLASAARRILGDRPVVGRGKPLFLRGIRSIVHREPMGVVLIIGTWNYPIFLVGTQILQAVVAGNAVLIKPALGCEKVSRLLVDLLVRSGMPESLCAVLGESAEQASEAIRANVDLIVLTGSSETGRKVLEQASKTLTPAIMELSGCDAVLILESANLKRAVDSLLFGLRLNGSATCMAPRRIFVPTNRLEELKNSLQDRLNEIPDTVVPRKIIERIALALAGHSFQLLEKLPPTVKQATPETVESLLLAGRPAIFFPVSRNFPLSACDIFAPVLIILPYDDLQHAIDDCNQCKYALTAAIFGEERLASLVASQLAVGMVIVNDLIAPTADPRLPFGGRGESGYGVTRGVEGLLQMTRPKVISVNRAGWLPHLDPPQERDAALLEGILQWCHAGNARNAFGGLIQAFKAIFIQSKSKSKKNESYEKSNYDPKDFS